MVVWDRDTVARAKEVELQRSQCWLVTEQGLELLTNYTEISCQEINLFYLFV